MRMSSGGNIGIGTTTPTAQMHIAPPVSSIAPALRVTGAANTTNNTASAETPDLDLALNRTETWATGALAMQRAVKIAAPTYSFAGASTLTNAATLGITGAPLLGTNATVTNTHALLINGSVLGGGTNSYGLTVYANVGASYNYAAEFLNGNVGIGTTAPTNTLAVSPLQYTSLANTASQSLFAITGVGTAFTAAMVGSQIVFVNGVAETITSVTNATTATGSVSQTVASQVFNVYYPGLEATSTGNVGIGTTTPQVSLDLGSKTDAVLLPSGATGAVASPVNGMIRYNTTTNKFEAYENGAWTNMIGGGGGGSIDSLTDAGTTATSMYLGIGAGGIVSGVNPTSTGANNTALGINALKSNIAKTDSTAIGYEAMYYADNTAAAAPSWNTAVGAYALEGSTTASANTGRWNTAVGHSALAANIAGYQNTAVGTYALTANTSGNYNTALGYQALQANVNFGSNTAIGALALQSNTGNGSNTAVGMSAMEFNTSGVKNVAIGNSALVNNSTGGYNIAIGINAMTGVNTGSNNIAFGTWALYANTTGFGNTAIGGDSVLNAALQNNTTGTNNIAVGDGAIATNVAKSESTAVGYQAMYYADSTATAAVSYNTAVGAYALKGSGTAANNTGTSNTAVGHSALKVNTGGNNNVGLGSGALAANTTGSENVAVGDSSLETNIIGTSNTAVGGTSLANTTGGNNTALGYQAGYAGTANTTGSSNTFIGYQAQANGAAYTNSTALGANAIITASNTMQFGDLNVVNFSFASGSSAALRVPNGTVMAAPLVGMVRYNTTTNAFEGYQGSTPAWGALGSGGGLPSGATQYQMIREGAATPQWENAPYDLATFIPGIPTVSEIARIILPRAAQLPLNLPGSQCYAKTAATASTTVTLNKISSGTTTAIGTAVWAAAAKTCTFTFSANVTFAASDLVEFVFPATPDVTLADIAITLTGIRQ